MINRTQLTRLLSLGVTCVLITSLHAQEKKQDSKAKKEVKKETIADKTKKSRKSEGLFTVYQDTVTGSVQLYVRKDQVNKEFIYQSFSMGGPADLFLNQNMLRETWVFSIQKKFNRIEFHRANTNFWYDPANAISKSANVDVSESVFYSDTALLEDSIGYLISMDGLLISDKLDPVKPNFPPGIPPTQYFNLGALNTAKSGYEKIRSYPENTDFLVSLAYDNAMPQNNGGKNITDARYVRVKMQHSFIAMPVNDYKPRRDDPRVGYFTQQMDNLTTYDVIYYKDLINRWHLKKKDPAAAMSEPVEPIVWWVENTTPVQYRQTILEAGRKWNEAFEKAGFRNAVVMKMMPDTASWDPADIRYNVIRWVSSDLGYAIGPSFVNPRTGQILGSDITIDWGIMSGALSEESLLKGMTAYKQPQEEQINHAIRKHWVNCSIARDLRLQQDLGKTVLETTGAGPEELKTLREQFLTMIVMHEMGHTMGLNHNMKASHMLSPDELTNTEITRKIGVMGSVMDYDAVNAPLDRSRQGDYYTTKTGPYDWWAIEYGYTPFSAAEEEAGLNKILSRSTDPKLIFGNDADITGYSRGIDPRVQVWDMSNDVVAFGTDRFKLVNTLMGKLPERYAVNGKSYAELRSKFNSLNYQRYIMANAISRFIGGIYIDRSFVGQAKDSKPFTPVPETYQKSAMAALEKYVFAPDAYDADVKLYPFLQMQRRGFDFFNGTEDPKPQNFIGAIQMSAIDHIIHPVTMQRINTSTLYGNTYSATEVLGDLVKACFDADLKGDVNLNRQYLQVNLTHELIDIVNKPGSGYDQASKSAALQALRDIRLKMTAASSADPQTIAHRQNISYLIDKALVIK